MPTFAKAQRTRLGITVALLAVLGIGCLLAVLARSDDEESSAAEPPVTITTTIPPPPGATTGVRATGPGTCAFLSEDDVRQANAAPEAHLRQQVGPGGGPGCEWDLGDPSRVVQLEFGAGPGAGPAFPAKGEDVKGPWSAGRWVADSRSLYVRSEGLVLVVRVTDEDAAKAKEASTQMAVLASARA